jgi:putative phosphoesterase
MTNPGRVAAISDIHGNLPALEAVLADVEREGIETIVVAGDTISGPWAAEVFDLVKDAGGLVVRGNADREVIERSDRYGPLARWSAERMGDERLSFAASWPLTLELDISGLGRVLVCHSTPDSEDPIYTSATPDDEVEALFEGVDARVVLCGHTHMQYDRVLESGLRIVNPGSVGMPYEGARGAFWATFGPGAELRRTDYDVEAAAAAIEVIGAPVDERFVEYLLEPPDPGETTAYFESLRGA